MGDYKLKPSCEDNLSWGQEKRLIVVASLNRTN